MNWGDVYDANHTDRLAVIVGGKYNGSQTETFYRVDFKNDVSGEKWTYCVTMFIGYRNEGNG